MKTEIIAILDGSGSMAVLASETISAFNAFIEAQRKEPGEAKLSVVRFNTTVRPIYSGKPIAEAPLLTPDTYTTEGYTALHDAIGATLTNEAARIAREAWGVEKVICLIATDGLENASREFTAEQVRTIVSHCEAHSWSFVYMGANQDAFSVSQSMGMRGQSMTYNATSIGTHTAYQTATTSVSALRAGAKDASLESVDLTKPKT